MFDPSGASTWSFGVPCRAQGDDPVSVKRTAPARVELPRWVKATVADTDDCAQVTAVTLVVVGTLGAPDFDPPEQADSTTNEATTRPQATLPVVILPVAARETDSGEKGERWRLMLW
jgi:hypothetical protein